MTLGHCISRNRSNQLVNSSEGRNPDDHQTPPTRSAFAQLSELVIQLHHRNQQLETSPRASRTHTDVSVL